MTRTGHAGEVDGNGRTVSAGCGRTKGRATTVALPFARVFALGRIEARLRFRRRLRWWMDSAQYEFALELGPAQLGVECRRL